jgi:hypothetical protein
VTFARATQSKLSTVTVVCDPAAGLTEAAAAT